MKQLKIIIIDDEQLARVALKQKLYGIETLKIVAEAENIKEAIEQISLHQPDLLLLDIQLYNETGFDLLEKIKFSGHVIFVTAYDSYAIRAFEINALDYILKPVTKERLLKAISRVKSGKQTDKANQHNKACYKYNDKVVVTESGCMKFLSINNISYIVSSGDYSEIYSIYNKKYLIKHSMSEWEKRLPQKYFIRIHRSTIINLEKLEKFEKSLNYSFQIFMKDANQPLKLGRTYMKKFKSRFNL